MAAAAQAARQRKQEGWVLTLQNTTQQPYLANLSDRATRQELFEDSWNRAERGGPDDTRATIIRLAQLRAAEGEAAWLSEFCRLETRRPDGQDAGDGDAVHGCPGRTGHGKRGRRSGRHPAPDGAEKGGAEVQPWDWDYYAGQVRKAKYDIDDAQVRPYFELNQVLENGVFYAANQLYGITFSQRKDIPVYHPDVRVFEVKDADGKPLALFYCDYFKRDNKNGGPG